MQTSREQEALKAYIKVLNSQGVSQRVLIQREFIIQRLSEHLTNIDAEGASYRQAVDAFIQTIDSAEVPAVLPVIREFYSFWVKDIKGIVAMSQAKVFNGTVPMTRTSQDILFKQWYELDKTVLLPHEHQALTAFHDEQLLKISEPLLFRDRIRLTKYLLVALRDINHKQSLHYRQLVDMLLPFFHAMGTHHIFLSVAREFYPYWRNDSFKPVAVRREMAIAA